MRFLIWNCFPYRAAWRLERFKGASRTEYFSQASYTDVWVLSFTLVRCYRNRLLREASPFNCSAVSNPMLHNFSKNNLTCSVYIMLYIISNNLTYSGYIEPYIKTIRLIISVHDHILSATISPVLSTSCRILSATIAFVLLAHDHSLSTKVIPVVYEPTTNLMLCKECHYSVYNVTHIYNTISAPLKPPKHHPCYTYCALLLQCNMYVLLLCLASRVLPLLFYAFFTS